MTQHETYETRTEITIVFPASGATDLTDPFTGRIVIPHRVELGLHHIVTPDEDRQWAHVTVRGPRRLKSGGPGHEISTHGWHAANQREGYREAAYRPDWLTQLVIDHWPDGWSPALVELTATALEARRG
ncbi:hypothetical protein ABZ741_04610 [Streptomyces globisporus]|uniref:hypothetical protein n=1 Tax=Streptomyces globisporus TaxID=1908 RepID=UPI003460FB0D